LELGLDIWVQDFLFFLASMRQQVYILVLRLVQPWQMKLVLPHVPTRGGTLLLLLLLLLHPGVHTQTLVVTCMYHWACCLIEDDGLWCCINPKLARFGFQQSIPWSNQPFSTTIWQVLHVSTHLCFIHRAVIWVSRIWQGNCPLLLAYHCCQPNNDEDQITDIAFHDSLPIFVVLHAWQLMLLTHPWMNDTWNKSTFQKKRKHPFNLVSSHSLQVRTCCCLKNDCWHDNYWRWRFSSFDYSSFHFIGRGCVSMTLRRVQASTILHQIIAAQWETLF